MAKYYLEYYWLLIVQLFRRKWASKRLWQLHWDLLANAGIMGYALSSRHEYIRSLCLLADKIKKHQIKVEGGKNV